MSMASSNYTHHEDWNTCREEIKHAIQCGDPNRLADMLFGDKRDICLELLRLPIDGDAYAIHLVCSINDGNALCFLEFLFGPSIEKEFRPDVNIARNDTGDTPLIIASRNGLENTIVFLLEHGADTECVNYNGEGFDTHRTVATSGLEDSETDANDAFVEELITQLQTAQTKSDQLEIEKQLMQQQIDKLNADVAELKDHIFRQSQEYLKLKKELEKTQAQPLCSKCSLPTLSLHTSPSRGPSRPPSRPQRSPSPGDAAVVMGSEQIHTSGAGTPHTPHTPLRTSSFASRSGSLMSLVDRCSERSVEEKRSVRENYRSLNGHSSHNLEEDEDEDGPAVVFGVEPMDITPRDHHRTAGSSVFVDRFTSQAVKLPSNGVNKNGGKRDCTKSNKSVPNELNAFESGPSVSSLDEMTNARRNLQMGGSSERPVFSKDEVNIEPSKQH